ncbi:MAG: aminodeoxychorismate/anthranilate synthase component II [Actinomycetota bacterium]|nr:aminodeoxychorismate/anthranilate synthase component II [Actinomycetota bacterium]
MRLRVLVVDNYDSFVYNLAQYLGELGAEPHVVRNDAITVAQARSLAPDAVVISPGPGRPDDAGVSTEIVTELGPEIPTLGVCLGHQCIGQAFGAAIVRAPEIMHGKTSLVHHDGGGVLAGLANPFEATRYHSLVVEAATVPGDALEITARTAPGSPASVVMGLRHRRYPIEGVQFHPESILTVDGHALIANFLRLAGARRVHAAG